MGGWMGGRHELAGSLQPERRVTLALLRVLQPVPPSAADPCIGLGLRLSASAGEATGGQMRNMLKASLARAVVLVLVSLALVACYGEVSEVDTGRAPMDAPIVVDIPTPDVGHAPDIDMPPDVPPDVPPDAPPPMVEHWSRVTPLSAALVHERCAAIEGQAMLDLRLVLGGCDALGNILWSVDPATRHVSVEPVVWRPTQDPPCMAPDVERVESVLLIDATLTPGTWTIAVLGVDDVIEVVPSAGPGGGTCSSSGCFSERQCIGSLTPGECYFECWVPCFPAGDRTFEEPGCSARRGLASSCSRLPDWGGVCLTVPPDCARCPAGMICNRARTRCVWDVPAERIAEPCTVDADCAPGLSCVEEAASRTCELRCTSDHPCPGGTECGHTEATCPPP